MTIGLESMTATEIITTTRNVTRNKTKF
jgi:hypothetical protein